MWGSKASDGSKSVEPLTIMSASNTVPLGRECQITSGASRRLEKIIENMATLKLTLEDEGLETAIAR